MNQVEILATGPELIRRGIRGTEPVIEEIIECAEREIQVVAYVFTLQAIHLLNLIEKAAERGVRVEIIVNRLEFQEEAVRSKLASIRSKLPNVRILNYADPEGRKLHAKIVIVDRKMAVLGSANFSWGGLYGNYEIGLFIQGDAVWKLANVIDILSEACERF